MRTPRVAALLLLAAVAVNAADADRGEHRSKEKKEHPTKNAGPNIHAPRWAEGERPAAPAHRPDWKATPDAAHPIERRPPSPRPQAPPHETTTPPNRAANPPRPTQPTRLPVREIHPTPGAEHPIRAQAPARADHPQPRPIAAPHEFVRTDRRAPPPTKDDRGEIVPPIRKGSPPKIVGSRWGDQRVLDRLDRTHGKGDHDRPGRYIWHRDHDGSYCHYIDRDGSHWYGYTVGSDFWWLRRHSNRWWYYDPIFFRWVYFDNGFWWWQDPNQPGMTLVLSDGAYHPVSEVAVESTPPTENVEPPSAPSGDAPGTPPAPATQSDVDEAAYEAPLRGDDVALVIGVEKYSSGATAKYAERDAAAMRAHLLALGYPERNISLLTGGRASRAELQKMLDQWLPAHVKATSRLFVYFAGLGAADAKTGAPSLLPVDANATSGISLETVYKRLLTLPATETIVALDTGFAPGTGRTMTPAGGRPASADAFSKAKTGSLLVFTAAGADGTAGSLEAQGHGLFTYEFLRGLNGWARATKDGVTADDVFDYIYGEVQDAAGRENRTQTPTFTVPPDGRRQLLIKDLRI